MSFHSSLKIRGNIIFSAIAGKSVGDNYDRFMVYERGRTVRNWDQATGRPIHVLSKRRNSALTGNLQTRSTFLSFSFLRRWNEQRLRYKICTKKIGIGST